MPPRLAMQRKVFPLNLLTPEGDISSFHHSPWHILFPSAGRSRQTGKESKEQKKSEQIMQEHHFPLLAAWPRALLSPVPWLPYRHIPVPASVLFSFLSLSLETSATSGCSQCLSWGEADTSGPNGDCLRPQKTSFVSSPRGQWYPVKASM